VIASGARQRFGAWLDNHLLPCCPGGFAWKVTPGRGGLFRPLIEMCSRILSLCKGVPAKQP
jgi:hypothetical protein